MTQMQYIKWEPYYSVHVDALDEQHKKLFEIINDLSDELEYGSGKLLPVIRDLVNYLAVHFHDEHIVMMDSNYPGFEKHSREHRHFTEKVEEFLASYQEGDADLGRKMIIFLKEWIYTHTTKLDMRYADHLAANAEELMQSGKMKLNL